ncbi:MAG: Na+/H+ antiporter NhaC family protein [Micromonosporaceae bacterium]
MTESRQLTFRGGWLAAFVPVIVFLFFCVLYFVVLQAFDLTALAMGGFVALLVGALLSRNYARYWSAVMGGISSPSAVVIVVILLVIGMLAELIKVTNVSQGFVWLARELGINAGLFTFFTFLTVCAVAMATGSSIGTMFTAFPIFYPAGVVLGAEPALLAGAIVSGAIFGDNLAPISDTTIISAATQRFRRKAGVADIAGVVRSRARYALVAAGISGAAYLIAGSRASGTTDIQSALQGAAKPAGLVMLIPVAIMLVVAFLARDIFKAVTVGLVLGTVAALWSGLLSFDGVIGVSDGAPTGYLVLGVAHMLPTVALVIAVFGIVGVLTDAGVLERTATWLVNSRFASTPRGAEASIAFGSTATAVLFGGVNSASMLAFGPVADEIGSRVNLHPYRRSNVMDCFSMGIAAVVPFLSAFLLIGASLTKGYDFVQPLGIVTLFTGTLYPLVLTLVMAVAVFTGWGRRFEGPGGAESPTSERVEEDLAPAATVG